MTIPQFSLEVQSRAQELEASSFAVVGNGILNAIAMVDFWADEIPQYGSKWLERCLPMLTEAGISDDATAIAYLNNIEPIVHEYCQRREELERRHREEMSELNDQFRAK